MKKYLLFIVPLLGLAACVDTPTTALAGADGPSFNAWGVDNDGDGIDDGTEMGLANQYAPVLYMPNLISRMAAGAGIAGDWTWPATVAWYLPQVRMRIHHNNCPDHQMLDVGQVNSTNLLQQAHQRYVMKWYGGCEHESPWQYSDRSWHDDDHYFLQAGDDDAVHPGIGNSAQWHAYFHAYPNSIGGISIQYWIFYAYNDFVGSANHEGDWEHINVRLNASHQIEGVWYAQHGSTTLYSPGQISWYGSHPQVWVADGSHASYVSEADCDYAFSEAVDNSCWTSDSNRWFTWGGGPNDSGLHGAGLINVGELPNGTTHRPMPGQEWIRYSGRWGEKGNFDKTSGPPGPAYQPSWTRDWPSTGTGGGGSGGGDCSGGGEEQTAGPGGGTEIQPVC